MVVLEALIELIGDYYYLLAVVAYFIFKLVRGSGDIKQAGMPTFGGDKQDHDDDDEEYGYDDEYERQKEVQQAPRQFNPTAAPPQPEPQYVNTTSTHTSTHMNLNTRFDPQSLEEARKRLYERENAVKQKSTPTTNATPIAKSNSSTIIDAKDIRKAVIWSEILGQPRAKRPYRR